MARNIFLICMDLQLRRRNANDIHFFQYKFIQKLFFISNVINVSTIESMQKSNIRHMALIVFFICMDLKSRVETSQMIFIFSIPIYSKIIFISNVINVSSIESMQKSNIRHMDCIVFFICMDLKSRVETSQMIFIFSIPIYS